MIKKLTLHNFECYSDLVIDVEKLHEIRGTTDTGKSSIIRALRWVCLNKGNIDTFVTWGHKEGFIKIQLDTGEAIKRVRGKSKNEYWLDEARFVSFGSTVPDPIKQVLNVSGINFQMQFDSHFLLADSAGEVGRKLNHVLDLSLLDQINQSLNQQKRSVGHELESTMVKRDGSVNRIKRLKNVSGFRIRLDVLQEQNDSLDADTRKKNRLEHLCLKAKGLSENKIHQLDVSKWETALERIEKLRDKRTETGRRCDKLSILVQRYHESRTRAHRAIPDIQKVDVLVGKWDKCKSACDALNKIITLYTTIDDCADKINATQKKMKPMQDTTCDYCGQVIA